MRVRERVKEEQMLLALIDMGLFCYESEKDRERLLGCELREGRIGDVIVKGSDVGVILAIRRAENERLFI